MKLLTANLDGITPLPNRHVATIKTYLEAMQPAVDACPPLPPGALSLHRLTGAEEPRYRTIFATLGARWLWWSRLQLSAEARAAILDQPHTHAFAVTAAGRDVGLLELDFSDARAPELAFLGLYEEATGKGLGPVLLGEAFRRAFTGEAQRLRVNTCTFDSPAALAFYRRHGFAVVSQAVEIAPDPRLSGVLPRGAAPHVPVLE